jgi:aspartyl/asparaginyl beta-hydroxylase (cupin superfamily)
MSDPSLEHQADAAAAARDFVAAKRLLAEHLATSPDHFDGWLKLSAMARATNDFPACFTALDRALKLRPLDFAALLMRATQLHNAGRVSEAGPAYGRALAQAPDPAPPQLEPVLAAAAERYQAWQEGEAEQLRSAVGGAVAPKLERFITNAVRLTAPDREGATHYCYPGLPEIPFHDRVRFDWIEGFDAATDTIQSEFEAVLAAEAVELVPYIQYPEGVPLAQWQALNKSRDWTAIHLIERGRMIAANARHCPHTMKLLASLPQPSIPGAGPNAMFSLLAPNTHIPPHTGIANTRLVCHLPLIVPPGCWFRVGDDRREWQRGKAWVFDDTIEHEAMNPSDALRVILIVDLWHADLDAEERAGVAAVIGAGGKVHGL